MSIVCWLLFASLSAGEQAARTSSITIYVGPQIRDGFVDVDKGVVDSIKDIQGTIRRKRQFRLVATPDGAEILLFVVGRGIGRPSGSVGVPIGVLSVVAATNSNVVEALLRVGSFEKALFGEGDDWRDGARQIARDLETWVSANRERLPFKSN